MTGVLVVSDTHLTAATLDRMPAEVWDLAAEADVVLHAGDVTDRAVLDRFRSCAPVHAVLGNNDHALVGDLPEVLDLDLGGLAVGMVHDSGPTAARLGRMARRFPDARIVVFGHSHDPLVADAVVGGRPLLLVNPGSPVQRRRAPVHTVAWLELADGEILDARLVQVGPLATR